jgi:hypothetical protein
MAKKTNDLFFTTLEQLHGPAPKDLLNTLRAQLRLIQQTNPNSAQTAEACLDGLHSDRSSLLHVLTAAYLINGGVMLKHQVSGSEGEEKEETAESLDFGDLEAEIQRFTLDDDLKGPPESAPPQSQSHPPAH